MDADSIFHITYKYFSAEVDIPKNLKRARNSPSDEFTVSISAQSLDDTDICIYLNSAYCDTEPIEILMVDRDAIAFAKAILHIVALRREYERARS